MSPDFLKQVPEAIGASCSPNKELWIGNEIIFSIFNAELPSVLSALRATLNASRISGVPVSIVIDAENWWGSQPELWNWWDPNRTGYDARNVDNVEWFGPTNRSAVKIGWRNWGSQIRVTPQQNVLSAAVLAVLKPKLHAMAAEIAGWYHSLESHEKFLLAAVKVGWEAGLQYNAYYYPHGNQLLDQPASEDPTQGMKWSDGDIGGGLPILGYAAASSELAIAAGISLSKGQKLDRNIVARLTRLYVTWLANVTVAAGVPPERVVNHVGGQQPISHAGSPVIPYNAGFSEVGVPGYSFYWGTPSATFVAEMKMANRTRWAAAEWNLRGKNESAWFNDFRDTLTVLDCAHIAVYNWDNDFAKQTDGHAAVRKLLETWTI